MQRFNDNSYDVSAAVFFHKERECLKKLAKNASWKDFSEFGAIKLIARIIICFNLNALNKNRRISTATLPIIMSWLFSFGK